jgi:hypothetical protein
MGGLTESWLCDMEPCQMLSTCIAGSDDTIGKVRDPLVAVVRWVKSRSPREKLYLGALGAFLVSNKTHNGTSEFTGTYQLLRTALAAW